MRQMSFAAAIEDALMQAMAADPRIVIFGEDVHAIRMNLFARFGEMRVRPIPISKAVREGNDLTMVSVGVGVHRCPEAAKLTCPVSSDHELGQSRLAMRCP